MAVISAAKTSDLTPPLTRATPLTMTIKLAARYLHQLHMNSFNPTLVLRASLARIAILAAPLLRSLLSDPTRDNRSYARRVIGTCL